MRLAMKTRYFMLFVLLLLPAFFSCKRKSNDTPPIPPPNTDTPYVLTPDTLSLPAHYPQPVYPADNPPYKERILLGRMLYYDPILSNDGRACAGCHIQANGFTTPVLYNHAIPVLPHVNLAWYSNFMWDGSKSGTLEDVMLFEVSSFFGTDLNKMNNSAKYKPLFKKYFNVTSITYKELSYALAQFLRTVVSGDSKYDRVNRGQASFTADEYMGYRIFFTEKGDCFHCHLNPLMTDNAFHNTGLDSLYATDADKGYFNVTGNANDLGKFRTPNLHNVALRKYFMHDGRFTTLEEVIDFCDHGMHKVGNLDPIMALPAKADGLHLSDIDKRQLIAFLNTLTDSVFITNPDFADPN
jgi:cytochrome c peroxidase